MIKIPQIPYSISGQILDVDNSTPLEGATVTGYIKERKVAAPSDTSDSNGSYIIELANASVAYVDEDNVTLEAVKNHKWVQYQTTIKMTEGEETKNLTMTYRTPLGMVIDILNDNWNIANTDLITPQIAKITDFKEVNFDNFDYVMCYEVNENYSEFGIGGSSWSHIGLVSIDIRTTFKRANPSQVYNHTNKLKEEVLRIMKANLSPSGNYQLLRLVRKRDLSDKGVGMGRMVIDCQPELYGS